MPPIVVEQLDLAKQAKWNFGDKNVFKSYQLFALLSNLFLSHGIGSPKNTAYPGILGHFKSKNFEKCNPVSLFLRFCGTLF